MDHSSQLDKCRRFLKDHDLAVIATADPDGKPHASVVNYFIHDTLEIYFIGREAAQKFRNIIANPLAAMVVTDQGLTSSLEIKGEAHILEDSPRVNKILMEFSALIRRKTSAPLPIMKYSGSELFLFSLKPKHITYADFRPSSFSDGEYFEMTL